MWNSAPTFPGSITVVEDMTSPLSVGTGIS
jgi:hypothetical protein